MRSRNIGYWIATAAILVQGPRLVLGFLAADRQPADPATQRLLLVLSGIGAAVVLTGGNLYLAHALAKTQGKRRLLASIWFAILVFSGALSAPTVAAGLGGTTLPQELGSRRLHWAWAIIASVAHELTAGGCMLAAAAVAGGAGTASASNESPDSSAQPRGGSAEAQGTGSAEPEASSAQPKLGSAQPEPSSAQPVAASADPDEGSAAEPVLCRRGCGRSFPSAAAELGHQRHCPSRRVPGPSGPSPLEPQ